MDHPSRIPSNIVGYYFINVTSHQDGNLSRSPVDGTGGTGTRPEERYEVKTRSLVFRLLSEWSRVRGGESGDRFEKGVMNRGTLKTGHQNSVEGPKRPRR